MGGSATGFVVASTGLAVASSVGDSFVGAADATSGSSTGSVAGDPVVGVAGAVDGTVETRGASVGNCARGASLQISGPPITLTGVISEHCRAFWEGYPEFANVLPATNSNWAVIPSLSTHSPQPLTSSQLAATETFGKTEENNDT